MALPAPTGTFRDRRSRPLIPWLCLTLRVQPQVPWSFPGSPALCRVVSPSTLLCAVSLTSCPAHSGPALLPPVPARGSQGKPRSVLLGVGPSLPPARASLAGSFLSDPLSGRQPLARPAPSCPQTPLPPGSTQGSLCGEYRWGL